jgi:carbonic anhydrase/acetyltransferase-like protein (isoleucine patch superfamily)
MYKLTEETKTIGSITLHRIELIKDCRWGSKGDKGGWIQKEINLQQGAWVSGNAKVYGDAQVSGNARVYGNAKVYGDAQVSGNARVYGNAKVYGDAQVSGNARVYGNAKVYGDAQVSGNAWVYGDAWEFSPLQIQGTKHYFNICKIGYIKIGCIEKSIDDWEKQFEQIGKEKGYTKEQINEYKLYIQLAKKLWRN